MPCPAPMASRLVIPKLEPEGVGGLTALFKVTEIIFVPEKAGVTKESVSVKCTATVSISRRWWARKMGVIAEKGTKLRDLADATTFTSTIIHRSESGAEKQAHEMWSRSSAVRYQGEGCMRLV